ncbi:MAG: lipoprotein-releasing system permease protein, partial [Pseudomonadota bacterium]|nr:lipoprotein-releasing system permease protein [Pseudomonadota bacterium]
ATLKQTRVYATLYQESAEQFDEVHRQGCGDAGLRYHYTFAGPPLFLRSSKPRMALPYELLIGLRYTRAKRRNHFISFISLISMLGVALGVAALIVVLSVMNGFQKELRGRILAVVSHVQVLGGASDLADWPRIVRQTADHPEVKAAAPFVQAQGMLSYNQNVRGTMVRGVLPDLEDKVADFRPHMKSGSLDALTPDSFGIVLGSELARALGVFTGDRVTLIAPQGVVTPAGVVPRLKTFNVVGIFEVGMFEYDNGLALVAMADAQKLYRMEDRVSGVRLKLKDLFQAPRVAHELGSRLDVDAYLSDWTRSHANFFRAVQIEKNMMFIILSLIVAVAAFNIVSTLVMAVTDKQSDIAILRTLGASPGSIMAVFMVQGALIGTIGLGLGVAGGVALALNIDVVVPFIERMLGTQFLSKDIYYISQLPSDLQWNDVTGVTLIAFVLALLATVYPSWRASRVNPAEALRYE